MITRHPLPAVGHEALDSALNEARDVLALLAARPGFVRGWVGRAVDDGDLLVLAHEWSDVGSYRRALGGYEVKLHSVFLQSALDEPSAFEVLTQQSPTSAVHHPSAIAPSVERPSVGAPSVAGLEAGADGVS